MSSERKSIRIRSEEYFLSRQDVIDAATREAPRRVNSYFVEVSGRQFPPKQLLRAAAGTTQTFDTAVAIRALKSLGFDVVRVEDAPVGDSRSVKPSD